MAEKLFKGRKLNILFRQQNYVLMKTGTGRPTVTDALGEMSEECSQLIGTKFSGNLLQKLRRTTGNFSPECWPGKSGTAGHLW